MARVKRTRGKTNGKMEPHPGGAGFTGRGKTKNSVILTEANNLSLFLFLYLNRREILRFAQNDGTKPFFRSLFSLCGLVHEKSKTHRLKPVLLAPMLDFAGALQNAGPRTIGN